MATTPIRCVFVQVRCRTGTTYEVAARIVEREFHSQLYSTSGDWDLITQVFIPEGEDVGRYVATCFGGIEDIERTLTTITFNAF